MTIGPVMIRLFMVTIGVRISMAVLRVVMIMFVRSLLATELVGKEMTVMSVVVVNIVMRFLVFS